MSAGTQGKTFDKARTQHFGQHEGRQRHQAARAQPAVEPAQHIDAIEQRTQQRRRPGVGAPLPVRHARFISAR